MMVAEWGRWRRPRRGGCALPVQVTRTVLPSRCRTAASGSVLTAAVWPTVGGDELRVRRWLRQRLDGAL
jgi:hypothetical protein